MADNRVVRVSSGTVPYSGRPRKSKQKSRSKAKSGIGKKLTKLAISTAISSAISGDPSGAVVDTLTGEIVESVL